MTLASSLGLSAQTFTQGNTSATTLIPLDLYSGNPDLLEGATLCLSFSVTAEWEADNHCGLREILEERGVDTVYDGFQVKGVDYENAEYNRDTGTVSYTHLTLPTNREV